MDVAIRPRDADDLEELARVLVRVHARDGYPVEGVANPQAWLTPPREFVAWTAVFDDRPIGQISLTQASDDDDAAVIWQQATGQDMSKLAIPVRLFVDPRHRRLGAGRLLMLAAHTFASEHGMMMAFDVMLKDREAIRLYEGLGCKRLGTVTHEHSDGQTEPAAVYVAPSEPISS